MADNAFDQANSALILAQSAFNQANAANTPAGTNQQVQFNDNGSFGANANFTFDKSSGSLSVKTLNISDDLNITNNIVTEGDIVPVTIGQNIGRPDKRWYNFYLDGGVYASGSFGNEGQVLTSDGYGTVKWTDPPSANINGNVTVSSVDSYARSTANSALTTAQAAFNKANTGSGGSGVDQYARDTANVAYTNTVVQQGVNFTQNTNISNIGTNTQAAFDQANAAIYNAASASQYANTGITLAQAAFNKANTGGSAVDQYARNTANSAYSSTLYLQSVNDTQNSSITNVSTTLQSAFDNSNTAVNNAASASLYANGAISNALVASQYANTGITLAQAAFDTANALSAGAGVDNTARIIANAAFNQANTAINNAASSSLYANTGITLAQAAFNAANSAAGISVTGNNVSLGSNTVGQLVSNAVTLTTSTEVTDGLALLNQVLGKLVPASPTPFPGATPLSISGGLGPYRMTNFTQTDNTSSSGKNIVGGTSVSPLRSSSYTTNTLTRLGPGDSGTLTVYKNGVGSGSVNFTTSSANGTYSDLIITNSLDYSVITGAAAGFWRCFDAQATGTVSAGWNEVRLAHTGAGTTTSPSWYYDAASPGTPSFTGVSIAPLSESITYSSTIPHYNSSTTFKLSVNVSKLSGDTFPSSNTFFTGSSAGAFQAPASNTYSAVGITYPLARNLYVSSGSVTVNTTASITSSAFGSSSSGPTVTVDNSYSTGTQDFSTALANTVLYKNGTSSSMEETNITIGSTIGSGTGLAARIINPGTTDTPAYVANATLFNSQTSTLTANDVTIVAATLKHDQTNYSTGYLPVGPNLSSGRSGAQYFTFKFVRTSVSKFDIQFTGTIAGLWVALPGSTIDSTSTLNGWIDMSTAYAGSGVPGENAGGNGSNGCALGGSVTLNSAVTNHRKTCTFGTVSSSSTSTNEIYVRIKLTSGQSVSALSLQTASN